MSKTSKNKNPHVKCVLEHTQLFFYTSRCLSPKKGGVEGGVEGISKEMTLFMGQYHKMIMELSNKLIRNISDVNFLGYAILFLIHRVYRSNNILRVNMKNRCSMFLKNMVSLFSMISYDDGLRFMIDFVSKTKRMHIRTYYKPGSDKTLRNPEIIYELVDWTTGELQTLELMFFDVTSITKICCLKDSERTVCLTDRLKSLNKKQFVKTATTGKVNYASKKYQTVICSICGFHGVNPKIKSDNPSNSCNCCHECRRTDAECKRCRICNAHCDGQSSCNCCHVCRSTDANCIRCRRCNFRCDDPLNSCNCCCMCDSTDADCIR